ncbi:hypothetical protein [Botrimarina mediterranea]|uniref:Uncharacterized protein n=1 Tax=Botrimarina mediterranea TaxID=2528022 RepID=A0A518K635_9BACT|nr:hypothetical protein [Botrimarina mediterranea]QDV73252.1 hypothetical protein Spa11_14480 [Botrimarina mediterranea]
MSRKSLRVIRWELVIAAAIPFAYVAYLYTAPPPPGRTGALRELPDYAKLPSVFDTLRISGDCSYCMKSFGTYFVVVAPVELRDVADWLQTIESEDQIIGAWKPEDTPMPAAVDVDSDVLGNLPVLFEVRDEYGFGRLYLGGTKWVVAEGTRRSN